VIGNTTDCAKELYYKTKQKVCNIARIYTDANDCYSPAFSDLGISDLHFVAKGKSQTHMIEAINSSTIDNLARFNRKSKRYSKCYKMIEDTLLLFFDRKQYHICI